MQIDLTGGYLFRPTTAQGEIADTAVSSAAMNARLKTYLWEAGLDDGETAHSFRSGCAVTLALAGSALADIMGHVGWERAHTARYYMQLEKVLRHDSTSALMAAAVDDNQNVHELTTLYQNLNAVKDFVLAFPPSNPSKRKSS